MDPTATLALLRDALQAYTAAMNTGVIGTDKALRMERDAIDHAADAYEAATNLDQWLLRGGFRPPEDPEGAECQRLVTAASEAAAVVLDGAHQEVMLLDCGECETCQIDSVVDVCDMNRHGTDVARCPECGGSIPRSAVHQRWFYWTCLPGCLPDSEPFGPYDTAVEAVQAALDSLSN